jgi:hypothetical protein
VVVARVVVEDGMVIATVVEATVVGAVVAATPPELSPVQLLIATRHINPTTATGETPATRRKARSLMKGSLAD